MAVMSQGGSYCIQSELVRCKAGSRVKQVFSGLHFSSSSSAKPTQILRFDGTGRKLKGANLIIVAASPPTEDAMVVAEPLTKEDLVGYLASGCKPKEKWRFIFYLLLVLSIFSVAPSLSKHMPTICCYMVFMDNLKMDFFCLVHIILLLSLSR